jgi:hypothetical protein
MSRSPKTRLWKLRLPGEYVSGFEVGQPARRVQLNYFPSSLRIQISVPWEKFSTIASLDSEESSFQQ